MAECARNYKVPVKLFYQWVSAASKKDLHTSEDSKELAKLSKENKRLNEELSILKKAAADFAKEMKHTWIAKHHAGINISLAYSGRLSQYQI